MLKHLNDPELRALMIAELEADERAGSIYLSNYQSDAGRAAWPELLREALESHDVEWLEQQLRNPEYWNATYQRRRPTGGFTQAKVPVSAPHTLAIGEFSRFYARGVCALALEQGASVRVIRAVEVERPRPESEAKIGLLLDPAPLLEDLRTNIGIDTALGVPAGPNSGLSIELA